MEEDKKIPINIGIFAHVDGGKTTLTENILFMSGAIRKLGRVDDGSAHTDFMEIERSRGISVRAASAFFTWNGQNVNLIDTPGHSDFTGEVQRTMRAVDLAVLVISAVEGVQPQTELIWNALCSMDVPTIFFINKTDRIGASVQSVINEISEKFGVSPVHVSVNENEKIIEHLCETNDDILEKYLEGGVCSISDEELSDFIRNAFYRHGINPYVSGSALKGEGVEELLDLMVMLAQDRESLQEKELSGVIFKLEHDAILGRVAYVRLYSGMLKNRDIVHNATSNEDEKVIQIRKVQGSKDKDVGKLSAGDIGAVYGLTRARNGDVIGNAFMVPPEAELPSPMLRVKITPAEEKDYPPLVVAMEQLSAEDPLLDTIWQKESRELIVKVAGLIQIEILNTLLSDRFCLKVNIEAPQVIYKERPSCAGEGFVEYTMPKPCWAVMRFAIEPLPVGSGVVFESKVSNDKIYTRYQAQIEQTIPEALRQGPKGWEVSDLKITLIDGEHHTVHTHPLDFVLATPMGIMDGLINTDTDLMEPMQKFRLSFPEEYTGKMIGEILAMRGTFDSPSIHKGNAAIQGRFPLAASMNFPVRLSALTGGQGLLYASFDGYAICPKGEVHDVSYRGVSPRERAKYILYKRGALG